MGIGKVGRMLHAHVLMSSTIYIIGGCNGAGKSTLARELLPLMGIERFLNADLIAKGLSPVNPALAAISAGRRLIEVARSLIASKSSFAIKSTLSGKTYVKMLLEAKAQGYRFVLHYVMIDSASQAVQRRFERSLTHFMEDYLPLSDEWGLWDSAVPPPMKIASDKSHSIQQILDMITSTKLQKSPQLPNSPMDEMVLEAGRVATAKILELSSK